MRIPIINLYLFSKVIEFNSKSIKKLCKTSIKNKYIRIIKLKKMTSTKKRLQEVYANFYSPY